MFDINKCIMGVSRGACFVFTAEFMAALIQEKEGVGIVILVLLIMFTAALGWY